MMIDITDLCVRYPGSDRPAVSSLSLRLGAGEVFGFIGPNGAGKTTTLRVLAGLVPPTSGRALVAGHSVVSSPAEARRHVGYLPDTFGVYEDLTCREYLDFFGAAQGLGEAERDAVIAEVLELTDLVGKADELAGSLSRGMLQRLGLARVLVHQPEVLLLDEPASGLDPRARIEVREILRELGRMGRTVVLSSHVLADLEQACTSVGIVEQGRLVYHGPVDEARRRATLAAEHVEVVVEALEGADALSRALAAAGLEGAGVEGSPSRRRVRLPASGADEAAHREAAARVARALAALSLTPVHLEVESADLERAFLHLTEGRVS